MGFPVLVVGQGMVDSDAVHVDTAVQEYDERLRFARNEQTGDYCIFLKMPPGDDGGVYIGGFGPYLPILGFGDRIPSPEGALRRLYETDSRRHGEEILERVNRRNDEVRKRAQAIGDEASGELAEVLEWSFRHKGVHPNPRTFVPKELPKED